MPSTKISLLSSGAPLQDTDEFVIARSGSNFKIAASSFADATNLVSQSDIGSAPNEIPLNQYLGTMAYQDLDSVIVGEISDSAGKLRAIPQSGAAKTASYTLQTSDVGQFIEVGSGGSITVPDATFSAGDIVSIFNNTTGSVTMTMSITTAYISGVDVDEATIDIATRGVATILFISGTVCVVSGNVS